MDHHPQENQAGASGLIPTPSRVGYQPDDSVAEIERAQDKLQRTLAAELARLGAQLHELRGGAYMIAIAGTCRHFDSFEACRQFCAQIEGRV